VAVSDIIQIPSENSTLYTIELPNFAGPLDLLLSLIEKEELDITKISLARVTDQYLAHLDILQQVSPDDLTDFLVVAAKLLLIKSEVLLPRPPPSIIEEEEEDAGDELARQLRLYKQFKEVATHLREKEEQGQRNIIRLTYIPPKIEPKLQPGDLSLEQLLQAAINVLTIKAPEPGVDEVVSREVVTIGQQMTHIRQTLQAQQEVSFEGLLSGKRDRLEVIVTLLAVLELIKRRVIKVRQINPFSDLIIYQNDTAPALSETEWDALADLTEVS
jgi:segregation and condensation protein A